jgi:hypothetical protein
VFFDSVGRPSVARSDNEGKTKSHSRCERRSLGRGGGDAIQSASANTRTLERCIEYWERLTCRQLEDLDQSDAEEYRECRCGGAPAGSLGAGTGNDPFSIPISSGAAGAGGAVGGSGGSAGAGDAGQGRIGPFLAQEAPEGPLASLAPTPETLWSTGQGWGEAKPPPAAVPGPVIGMGLPGLVAGCIGILAWVRCHRPQSRIQIPRRSAE